MTVRAGMPNPQDVLIDGQLVRVRSRATKPEEKILVPQSALIADQQGVYVFVVEDGKAAVRRVEARRRKRRRQPSSTRGLPAASR